MIAPALQALGQRLAAQLHDRSASAREVGEIPIEHYCSEAHFLAERGAIFARTPSIVAHSSELAQAGGCLAFELAGVSLLCVRGEDGVVRAFRNACRHRSTELVPGGEPCRKKALVCPYHGWTYDLGGELIHVPHAEAFQGRQQQRSLSAVYAAERHGLIFASLAPFELDEHLGPVDRELSALSGPDSIVYRRTAHQVRGNWKLIVDAFLDGYHIRHLHRDTVYRFFLDACVEAEPAGRHIRALTGRRALLEAKGGCESLEALRQLATPSYLIFPSTTLILHPDFLSIAIAQPSAADRTVFTHLMVVPRPAANEKEAQHWQKSYQLIDQGVFAAEDLVAVEAIQRGLASGANRTLLFGEQEHPALWFHRTIAACLLDC